eukprot:365072-Chlamydomonas_euryale.AAC.25
MPSTSHASFALMIRARRVLLILEPARQVASGGTPDWRRNLRSHLDGLTPTPCRPRSAAVLAELVDSAKSTKRVPRRPITSIAATREATMPHLNTFAHRGAPGPAVARRTPQTRPLAATPVAAATAAPTAAPSRPTFGACARQRGALADVSASATPHPRCPISNRARGCVAARSVGGR